MTNRTFLISLKYLKTKISTNLRLICGLRLVCGLFTAHLRLVCGSFAACLRPICGLRLVCGRFATCGRFKEGQKSYIFITMVIINFQFLNFHPIFTIKSYLTWIYLPLATFWHFNIYAKKKNFWKKLMACYFIIILFWLLYFEIF